MSRDFFVYQGDFSQEYLRIPRKINAERRKKTRQAGELYLISGSLRLVEDGTLPALTNNILQNLILADKHSGSELLKRLLITEGILSIQQGENPNIITLKLYSMLGEKYLPSSENNA